jgi:hypothetical protein
MITLASSIVSNQCTFKHSSRNDPLKVSTKELSVGLPCRLSSIRRLPAQPRTLRPTLHSGRSIALSALRMRVPTRERQLERLPLVQSIYGATERFLDFASEDQP